MRNSKIYCQVDTDRVGDKSFGCDDHLRQVILVGSSAKNCYEIGRINVESYPEDYGYSFELVVNGKIIKKVNFNSKSKEFTEVE